MSKLFPPLIIFIIFVSIYFVNTSSNSQSTITSLNTKNNFSKNGNSRSTGTGVSGIVQPDSERSVNQPDNHHQPPVDNQHLDHLLGHAIGYDPHYNNYKV